MNKPKPTLTLSHLHIYDHDNYGWLASPVTRRQAEEAASDYGCDQIYPCAVEGEIELKFQSGGAVSVTWADDATFFDTVMPGRINTVKILSSTVDRLVLEV